MKKVLIIVLVLIGIFILAVVIDNIGPFTSGSEMEPLALDLYKRVESWGPCNNENPLTCKREITITGYGGLLIDGEITPLSKEKIEAVENVMRKRGLLGVSCKENSPTLDYAITYYLSLNGKLNVIEYSRCSENVRADLEYLDSLISI